MAALGNISVQGALIPGNVSLTVPVNIGPNNTVAAPPLSLATAGTGTVGYTWVS